MKIKLDTDSFSIIGESPQIREVFDIVGRAASSQSTVMIYGESGTGKELIARALHLNSQRASKPFIAVNCAAIPHDLLESELFGYEKGSFTGAVNNRIGRIELANQGTIFLDEIGDMPPVLQVKLLRVLAEREIVPEILQNDFTVSNITKAAVHLLQDEDYRATMISQLKTTRSKLGEPGAYDKAARCIENTLR